MSSAQATKEEEWKGEAHTWYPSEETEYVRLVPGRDMHPRHRYQRNDTGSNFPSHVVSGLTTGTSSRTSKRRQRFESKANPDMSSNLTAELRAEAPW